MLYFSQTVAKQITMDHITLIYLLQQYYVFYLYTNKDRYLYALYP